MVSITCRSYYLASWLHCQAHRVVKSICRLKVHQILSQTKSFLKELFTLVVFVILYTYIDLTNKQVNIIPNVLEAYALVILGRERYILLHRVIMVKCGKKKSGNGIQDDDLL